MHTGSLKISAMVIVVGAVVLTFMSYGAATQLTESGDFIPSENSFVYAFLGFLGTLSSLILGMWKFVKWMVRKVFEENSDLRDENEELRTELEKLKSRKRRK